MRICDCERLLTCAFLRLILCAGLYSLAACGGGTVGTGTGPSDSDTRRVYAGSVHAAVSDEPIPALEVILESTGESTVTDSLGNFSLGSSLLGTEATFRLHNKDLDTTVSVKDIPAKSSKVSVQILIDPVTQVAQVNNIAAQVGIVGVCDYYFENNEIIRQANRVPEGTICTIGARVFGDGKALAAVPIALQRRACIPGAPWLTVSEGKTGIGINRGIAKLDFLFEDSIDACKYRVVVPYNYGQFKPSFFLIQTFTEQGLESKSEGGTN